MRRSKLVIFSVLLGLSLCACNSIGHHKANSGDQYDNSAHIGSVIKENAMCAAKWHGILDNWKKNGGGLHDSLFDTRNQVAKDKSSTFSRLVRDSWRKQTVAIPSKDFGNWPVSAEEHRRVIGSIPSKGIVPTKCEPPIWLDSWFWDDLRFVDSDPHKNRRLSDMPSIIDSEEPNDTANWVFYWLFVRIE